MRSLRESIAARAAPVSRWGLLTTAVALVAALLGTDLSTCLAVRAASISLVRSQAMDLVSSVRRTLHADGTLAQVVLQEVLDELKHGGVHYLAVLDPDGLVLAAAGTPAAASSWRRADASGRTPQGPGPQIELSREGMRARATGPYVGGGHGAGWRARTGASPDAEPPWESLANALIVVEFEPMALQDLTAHALATLVIGACTALVLLGAAVVFWRMSLRAERTGAQLERDRQLKTLGQMSAVLGHELRNPLAGLKGHAQLILRKLPAGHAVRNDAEVVVREAVRLEQLASDVLEFARTGKVQPRLEDPSAIARSAVEAVGSERVRLDSAPQGLPRWPLDRLRMEQVLTNLLRNAIQASGNDDDVELAAYVDGDDQSTLVFEVRDRGEGLAPNQEENVFEPFVTNRAKGSGLGLTLARQIVEGHGGRIAARDRRGGGAIFRVAIPRREV